MQGYCYGGARKNVRLDLEEMVIEPDESGRVSVVVANPFPEVVNLMSGQMLGVAYQCAEVSQGGKAVTGTDWGANHVSAD